MATLYTQQDKDISSKKKFFSSKTNGILLIILILLMVFAIKIMRQGSGTYFPMFHKQVMEDENNILPKADSWITTDFAHGCGGSCENYLVNISYPSDYKFGCCGDTEAGTYHEIHIPNMEATGVQILEGANYSCANSTVEGCTVEPEYYFADKIKSGEVTRIDDVETDHIGFSIFAVRGYTDEWSTNTPYERYIFVIPTNINKPYSYKYYQVGFFHPENMTTEFKTEFLNRLEIWQPVSTVIDAYVTGFEKREDGFWYLTLDKIRVEGGSDAGLPLPSGWIITNPNRNTETLKVSADARVQIDSENCSRAEYFPEVFEPFSSYIKRLEKEDFYYWNINSDAKYGWQLPGFYWVTIVDGVVTEIVETYNNCGA